MSLSDENLAVNRVVKTNIQEQGRKSCPLSNTYLFSDLRPPSSGPKLSRDVHVCVQGSR